MPEAPLKEKDQSFPIVEIDSASSSPSYPSRSHFCSPPTASTHSVVARAPPSYPAAPPPTSPQPRKEISATALAFKSIDLHQGSYYRRSSSRGMSARRCRPLAPPPPRPKRCSSCCTTALLPTAHFCNKGHVKLAFDRTAAIIWERS
ncbi:hypothetical protein GUJ93_ZPchr0003g16472 [Zizania palustris]|uniref:Uncharacterized protein n=1 Tax=Zizania palustris TaxID=103762 RepID=A0A8J5VIS4_ZIZPA|nr:hypothetical protein GUJ93_ZPchr0003g16472 [Zizania palustris]